MKHYLLRWLLIFTAVLPTGLLHGQSEWTLRMCIDTALLKNLDLGKSQNNTRIQKVNLRQSKDYLLPTLNATGAQNFSSGRSIDPYSYQYVTQNIFSNVFSVNSGVILFNGFQNRNSIRQSRINVASSEYDALEVQNQITFDVINNYFQVLYAYEQAGLAGEQVRLSMQQVNQTRVLVDAGKKTETDLLRLMSQLGADSLNLVKANSSLRMAKVILQQTMNVPMDPTMEFTPIKAPEPDYPGYAVEELYHASLQVMPEIKSARLKKESSLTGLTIYRGALLPKLSLTGAISSGYSDARKQVSYENTYQTRIIGYLSNNPAQSVIGNIPVTSTTTSSYHFFDQLSDNLSSSLSLNLSVPILNYRQVRNNIQRQKLNIQNAMLDEKKAETGLRKEIEQVYTDILNSAQNYEASLRQVEYAAKSYRNVQDRYDLGITGSVDLQVEYYNYIRAQSEYIQAKYQYLFNLKMLDVYLGNSASL